MGETTAESSSADLMVDLIISLDGYASAEGWPGWWGLEGPEYLAEMKRTGPSGAGLGRSSSPSGCPVTSGGDAGSCSTSQVVNDRWVQSGVPGPRRGLNGVHSIGFGCRALQRKAQAHLISAVPELGTGIHLDHQEWLLA
jgi:hypothetical protein